MTKIFSEKFLRLPATVTFRLTLSQNWLPAAVLHTVRQVAVSHQHQPLSVREAVINDTKRPQAHFQCGRGLQLAQAGVSTPVLNRGEFTKKLDALRAQIKADDGVPAELFPERLALAGTLLTELAAYEILVTDLKTPIATLRVTLSAYYSRAAHRPWARQYALQDLDKLAALAPQIPEA